MKHRRKLYREAKFDSAVVCMLKAYHDGQPCGYGYVVYYEGPYNGRPFLANLDGSELRPGWFNLECYEHVLGIVPRNVQ